MMSKKCKYALKALVRLGNEFGKGNLLTGDIAKSAHIPKKFLELILLDLKRGGYVQSKPGAGGGYRLVQEPKKIVMSDTAHWDCKEMPKCSLFLAVFLVLPLVRSFF